MADKDIPNCYDPVYQAERLAMEDGNFIGRTLYCSICESPIFAGGLFHEHLGAVVCPLCLQELTRNVDVLDYE